MKLIWYLVSSWHALLEMCSVWKSGNIRVARFGVKVQYKHIVVTVQINIKDYSYLFHLILIKLGIYDHWANVL